MGKKEVLQLVERPAPKVLQLNTKRLREMMDRKGMDMQDLAKAVGTSKSTLEKYFANPGNMRLGVLFKVAAVLSR